MHLADSAAFATASPAFIDFSGSKVEERLSIYGCEVKYELVSWARLRRLGAAGKDARGKPESALDAPGSTPVNERKMSPS